MSDENQRRRILPIPLRERTSAEAYLVLPQDFTDAERREIFKDATTAFSAGDVYMHDMYQLSGQIRVPLANAAAVCFNKATELATPSTLRLDEAEALLMSFEDRRGRIPDTGGLSVAALDAAIDNHPAAVEEPKSVQFGALAWQVLVRYVVSGRREHFDQAVDMWTRRVQDLASMDDADDDSALSHARVHLITTSLQKCTRHERDASTVQRALELAKEAVAVDEDESPFEQSILLAIAYEQSYILHGDREHMDTAIKTVEPLTKDSELEEEQQARAQYEFGRLNAALGMATGDRDTWHEGNYNIQRATEDTPRGTPLWERRQEVFQDYLEDYIPQDDVKGCNAVIRALKAQVIAAEAMNSPKLPELLEQRADHQENRYRRRHTLDDLHEAKECRKRAAGAAANPTLLDKFRTAALSVQDNMDLYHDEDDDPEYVETALRDGKLAMELFGQLGREEILSLVHPTFVGGVFQNTATAYRLTYDENILNSFIETNNADAASVENTKLLETAIKTLEKGIAFLELCPGDSSVRGFTESMRRDVQTHQKELDRITKMEAKEPDQA
ncbi:hypothetical protein VFPPC_06803 [Pochonia chlamydosporia 170]|uniref:KIF-binding protein n=1 Tax=Pochonia chlamydosporia 170 TaxID=1380566 RepID=A0A179F5I9_METCM|nr:hypothetical protein VFPPC_06803 [Pochonia chlamydosporia 170]OAQ60694.1 hypothetical protein VFPPC_06803 [Pochonia chlamydosporia 170]